MDAATADAGRGGSTGATPSSRAIWVDAVVPTVVIHLGVLVGGFIAVMVFRPEILGGDPLGIWAHWDAPHFFEIARYGYGPPADPARIVLFPLFPALIAVGSLVTSPLLAGMVISFVGTAFAAVGVYRLVRADHGRRTATAAVLALNLFPTSFAFVAPYSEAPFLAFTAWSLVRAREDDWRGSGLFALLASLTRLQGAFLIPALALEFVVRHRRVGWSLGWIGLAALGPIGYLWINLTTFGDAFRFVSVQDTVFHVRNIWPGDALASLLAGVTAPTWNESWLTVYVAPLLAEILLAAVVVWTLRSARRRPADAAYSLITFVSFATLSWPISLPRYILGVPALFGFIGTGIARRTAGPLIVAGLSALLMVCLTLFVIGHWAF